MNKYCFAPPAATAPEGPATGPDFCTVALCVGAGKVVVVVVCVVVVVVAVVTSFSLFLESLIDVSYNANLRSELQVSRNELLELGVIL